MNQIKSFGEYLRQFALSIDFISSTNYKNIKNKIHEYLKNHLGAHQIAFCIPAEVNDEEGFKIEWSFPREEKSQTLKDGRGSYRRQLAFAMGTWRNLWVNSESDLPLSQDNRGVDYWGEHPDENLPAFFFARSGKKSKTAIMLVARNARNNPIGVLVLEMERKVRISSALREELTFVGEAVGLLHASHSITELQSVSTDKALTYLQRITENVKLRLEARPALFFAYSERAPEDAILSIKKVLGKYDEHVILCDWKAMHNPGDIPKHITEEIVSAKYGICYFSETINGEDSTPGKLAEDIRFLDNANVLFEAGMLNISTDSEKGVGTGWIPIREKESPGVPFDIISQRRIIVPRDKNRKLEKRSFEKVLIKQLDKLIKDKLNHDT